MDKEVTLNALETSISNLAGMVKEGFDVVDDRFDGVERRLDLLEQGQRVLEQGQEEIKLRLSNKANQIDLDETNKRLGVVEDKLGINIFEF